LPEYKSPEPSEEKETIPADIKVVVLYIRSLQVEKVKVLPMDKQNIHDLHSG
jgi:hypothetical protein